MEHPADGKPDLKQATFLIVDAKLQEDGTVLGTLETLNNTLGRDAAALFKDGLSIGISSRARGSVRRRSDGIDEVLDDFMPETFDLVAEPSTPGAYLHESIQKKLSTRPSNELMEESTLELCTAQLQALREDVMQGKKWNPLWEYRLNDIKFLTKDFNSIKSLIESISDILKLQKKIKEAEEIVPEPEAVPVPPAEKSEIAHKVEICFEFNSIPDTQKKLFNIFRTGEDLKTIENLIRGQMDTAKLTIKNLTVAWCESEIKIIAEVSDDPMKAEEIIKQTVMGVATANVPGEEEELPVEEESVKKRPYEKPQIWEERSQSQVIKFLNERVAALEKEKSQYVVENKNLRILHNEMVKLFESEVVNLELAYNLKTNPELCKFKPVLQHCHTRTALQEAIQSCVSATKTEKPRQTEARKEPRSVEASTVSVTGSNVSDSLKAAKDLPTMDLGSLTESKNSIETSRNLSVADGPKSDTTFDRLATHRARQAKK
jgi:hypothetical protein